MGGSAEIFERMGADVGVERFRGEGELQFCVRAAYSASRFWVHAACIDDGAEGQVGLSKQGLNRRLKTWVLLLEDVMPGIAEWFSVEGGGMRHVYDRLIDVEDVVGNGFSNTYMAAPAQVVPICRGGGIVVGFFDPTGSASAGRQVMSGLATLTASSELCPSPAAARWWEADAAYMKWESASNFGAVAFADPDCARWNIGRSDVWTEEVRWHDAVALACAEAPNVGGRTFLVARKSRGGTLVAPISWIKAQELFFHLRAVAGNRAVARFSPIDAGHARMALPIGFVPGRFGRYLDALSWPVDCVGDRINRIVRAEALPLVEELLSKCSIGIKEA